MNRRTESVSDSAALASDSALPQPCRDSLQRLRERCNPRLILPTVWRNSAEAGRQVGEYRRDLRVGTASTQRPLGTIERLGDRCGPVRGQCVAAPQLIEVGTRDHGFCGPLDPLLLLRVDGIGPHQRCSVELVLGQMLAGREPQDV